jgi:hypothetical protein
MTRREQGLKEVERGLWWSQQKPMTLLDEATTLGPKLPASIPVLDLSFGSLFLCSVFLFGSARHGQLTFLM